MRNTSFIVWVTGMMADELMAVSQDRDSNDEMELLLHRI